MTTELTEETKTVFPVKALEYAANISAAKRDGRPHDLIAWVQQASQSDVAANAKFFVMIEKQTQQDALWAIKTLALKFGVDELYAERVALFEKLNLPGHDNAAYLGMFQNAVDARTAKQPVPVSN